jgi:hypothetical protein
LLNFWGKLNGKLIGCFMRKYFAVYYKETRRSLKNFYRYFTIIKMVQFTDSIHNCMKFFFNPPVGALIKTRGIARQAITFPKFTNFLQNKRQIFLENSI